MIVMNEGRIWLFLQTEKVVCNRFNCLMTQSACNLRKTRKNCSCENNIPIISDEHFSDYLDDYSTTNYYCTQ